VLVENTLFGVRDTVKIAIDRLRTFEPPEGYYLAFSGGKDSQCIYHLAKEAGVKFDAHYNVTGIDPPELVYFMRDNYPDVVRDMYKESMWRLIEKKGLPTRLKRFCCAELKEHGGEGRVCVTGVRWAESNARAKRKPFEITTPNIKDKMLFNDNETDRRQFENCTVKGKRVVNPIIDWEDADVWEYIHSRGLKYCKLYDEGFTRLGCIGCPMADKGRIKEFDRYPKFKILYKRAIEKFIPRYLERCRQKGREPFRTTADEWWHWWIYGNPEEYGADGQMDMFGEDED
jgi:phosphoadenosine phosphosulfate reductase